MLLIFNADWRGYVEGRMYDVPDGAAEIFLKRKLAKKVSGKQRKSKPPTPKPSDEEKG